MKHLYRLIFWGVIFIICIFLGVLGFLENQKNLKQYEEELNTISNNFNKSELVNEYNSKDIYFKSKIENNKLIIDYKSYEEKEYVFKLHDGYIETSYKVSGLMLANHTSINLLMQQIVDSFSGNFTAVISNLKSKLETLSKE